MVFTVSGRPSGNGGGGSEGFNWCFWAAGFRSVDLLLAGFALVFIYLFVGFLSCVGLFLIPCGCLCGGFSLSS